MISCWKCGTDNPERARFCLHCGVSLALASGSPRGTRKTVTVVFCDVTGSTGLGERLDPESLSRVMARYFDAMRAVLERHGGAVQKFIGDAVMAVFGIPVVHEDDALRAVRAAAAMQDTLGELNAELERDWGVGLQIRIGVSTGEVMVGDPRLGDTLVIGDAVNLATRLEQTARPGEVLLAQDTWRLVRDAVLVAPVAAEELQGGAGAPAYRLLDVSPDAPGHARRQDSPLVGRTSELQLFEWAYQRTVRESTCHLFTVLGAAGVGKSRLVAEAVDALGEAATVLYARCLSYGQGITLWPVAEAVRQAAGIKDVDSPSEARTKLDALLGDDGDGPQVAERIGRLIGLEAAAVPAEETAWAVRRFYETLAGRRPLLVVFDDLHWAEAALLDLIEQVVDLSREAPILLVAVARPELFEQRATWAGGKLNATTILLEPLDAAESAALLDGLTGRAALPAEVKARIAETAEGNPLFLEEMLAMLIEDGRLRRQDGRWVVAGDLERVSAPPSIHALLAARLDRLDGEERAVLERAAVAGQTFDLGAVVELSPPAVRTDVPARLASLVRKELLRPVAGRLTDRSGFQFRHLLVRDAAYESLPKQTRAELHERFASWLAGWAGERIREYEEILGYHLERAYRYRAELGPADEQGRRLAAAAAERLAAAGRRAHGRGDVRASVNLLQRAVALLPARDPTRLHLLAELGEGLIPLARYGEAERAFDEVVAAAAASDDPGLRAYATIGKLELRLETVTDRGPNTIREEAERVLEVLERLGDDQGLAKVWRLVALDDYLQCRIAPAEQELNRAIEHARRAGDERLEALCLYSLAQAAFWSPTPVPDGIRRCEQIRRGADGNYRVELAALEALAGLHAMLGEFEAARALAASSLAIAGKLGPIRLSAICGQIVGVAEMLAGDPKAAEERFRWAYGICERTGDEGLRAELAANLAQALCAQGRDDEVLRFSQISGELAAKDDLFAQVERRGPTAKVLARRGRFDEAERLAAESVALAEPTDMINMQADALVDLAEVLRLAGRAEAAAPTVSRAIELYERKGNLVSARRARDRLARLQGA